MIGMGHGVPVGAPLVGGRSPEGCQGHGKQPQVDSESIAQQVGSGFFPYREDLTT